MARMAKNNDKYVMDVFSKVGEDYEYNTVKASFVVFSDFKVRWQRSYSWAEFQVSDYLEYAPRQVLEDLAHTMLKKIRGQDAGYSDEMREYVLSDEFAQENQLSFIKRHRTYAKDGIGTVRNLNDSVERLKGMGLVNGDSVLKLVWMDKKPSHMSAMSTIMKVIAINTVLDNEEIPEFVLDYIVFSEIQKMMLERENFGHEASADYSGIGKAYPKREEAEVWRKRLGYA